MERKTNAIDKLQNIHAELAETLVEQENYDIEKNALEPLQTTLHEMLAKVKTLWQGVARSRLSPDSQALLTLLTNEEMRRASRLDAVICREFAAGDIRKGRQQLPTHLLVLNQAVEQLDRISGSRKA